MPMESRLALRLETPAGDGGRAELDALCARARDAEASGVDLVWLVDPRQTGLALHAAVSVASHTQSLRIGAELPVARLHPVRLAEDAATADGIAAGRLELCLAALAEADERSVADTVSILRGAWSPGPVGPEGGAARLAAVDVHPKPVHPEGPPLWLRGAAAPLAVELETGFIAASAHEARNFLEEWGNVGRAPWRARVGLTLPGDALRRGGRAPQEAPARDSADRELRRIIQELAESGGGTEPRAPVGTVDGIAHPPLGQSAL